MMDAASTVVALQLVNCSCDLRTGQDKNEKRTALVCGIFMFIEGNLPKIRVHPRLQKSCYDHVVACLNERLLRLGDTFFNPPGVFTALHHLPLKDTTSCIYISHTLEW